MLESLKALYRRVVLKLKSTLGLSGSAPESLTRALVDSDTFQRIAWHASFPRLTRELAKGDCANPSNGAQLIKYIQAPSTDTQAAVWKVDCSKQVVLGFPGTDSLRDWATDTTALAVPFRGGNVECPGDCTVHLGFLQSWESIAPEVMETLASAINGTTGYTTALSGHSLGGALATLAYVSLKNGPFQVTEAYTYGSPRVGNEAFAKHVDSLAGASSSSPGEFHRVTHANDGVPKLPFSIMGYVHSRTEYWESTEAAEMQSTFVCTGPEQEPLDCNLAVSSFGINAAHSSYAGFNVSCS